MLKKLIVLILLLTALPMPSAAAETTVRDRVVRELRSDGYSDIRLFRTFLGRLRFVARDGELRREIVVNPRTGVILRDYVWSVDDRSSSGGGSSASGNGGGSNRGSGKSGGGHDNDDDDDDDDDDDNSGSGSSNSGSGSSNSGSGSSGSGGNSGSGGGGGDDDDDDEDD